MVDLETNTRGQAEIIAKLTDFGFACLLGEDQKARTRLGTRLYMAPEVCRNEEYDCKIDVWSLGVIVYVMLAHKFPFPGNSKQDITDRITSSRPPDMRPFDKFGHVEILKDFVASCLDKNAKTRPTAAELLTHPWITTF